MTWRAPSAGGLTSRILRSSAASDCNLLLELSTTAAAAPAAPASDPAPAAAAAAAAADQGLTLVHIRAQLEQLQDTFMS